MHNEIEKMISVIIPSYNREKLIKKSVESVLAQTYGNIEVIIVDDCSTDSTETVAKSINDARVRYIKLEKNSGACIARNVGIDNARGKYIAFHDSDDTWRKNKLEIEMSALIENNADVVFSSFERHMGNKSQIIPQNLDRGFVKEERLLAYPLVNTPVILGKAKVFRDERFDEKLPRYQDFELMMRVVQKYKVYFIPEVLMDSFVQEDSLTKSVVKGNRAEAYIIKKHYDALKKYPLAMQAHLKRLGHGKLAAGENPVKEFQEAFRYYKSIKNFILLIIIPIKWGIRSHGKSSRSNVDI